MKETGFREFVLHVFQQHFTLTQNNLGTDAVLSARGMTFTTESWEIEEIGHLCYMRMKAPFGLMRMETAVVAPTKVDMPLFNTDWVGFPGGETQIIELYDTQLEPWPTESSSVFSHLLERDADIPHAQSSKTRWYDSILYPCSYHKSGKKLSERFAHASHDYLVAFVDQMAIAPACDEVAKAEKVRAFATRLFSEGGPAVDQVAKLFGRETAERIVVHHMYGVE